MWLVQSGAAPRSVPRSDPNTPKDQCPWRRPTPARHLRMQVCRQCDDLAVQLSPELAGQLDRVPKSSDGYCDYAPCRLTLRSGEALDRVYVVEAECFRKMWGHTQATVLAADVTRIEESPVRLPARWANKLYAAGESGMGYTLFTVDLRDGSTIPFVVGNAVDFPNWPPGVTPEDVVAVHPHAGREIFRHRAPGPYERSADYQWCAYDA